MVVLGLILILVAVVAGVVLVYENSGSDSTVTIHAFGGDWRADAYWLAVLGAVVLVVFVLGVVLIRSGGKRGLRRRSERKELERENAALAGRVAATEHSPRSGQHGAGQQGGDQRGAGQQGRHDLGPAGGQPSAERPVDPAYPPSSDQPYRQG